MRLRPDQRRQLGADALRGIDPVGAVPAADQPVRPLLLDYRALVRRDRFRQRPERIAVEIDDAFREMEAVPEPSQRIGGIGGDRLGAGEAHRPNALRNSSTAAAHAAVSGATSSTWPVASSIRTRTLSPAACIGRASPSA